MPSDVSVSLPGLVGTYLDNEPEGASTYATSNNGPPSPANIGPETVRRKQPSALMQPRVTSAVFSNTETRASARKRATATSKPILTAPASEPIGGSDVSVRGRPVGPRTPVLKRPLSELSATLAQLQRRRKFCIQQQSKADRSIESLIASTMGFRIDASEKERKSVFSAAKTYRLAIEKGGEGQRRADDQQRNALSALVPIILASASNRATWDKLRLDIEREMRVTARTLPVYAWAKSVKGFGDLGLAIISGEAGIPIGEYRTISGLWKRMGLAVINGERQARKRDKDEAAAHGYSPRRRAEIWTLADSMFRHQWHGAKEEEGIVAGPSGPYGEVYAYRRAHTAPRIEATADLSFSSPDKWTLARCNNDAKRIMTKALLRDLWVKARGSEPSTRSDSSATPPEE